MLYAVYFQYLFKSCTYSKPYLVRLFLFLFLTVFPEKVPIVEPMRKGETEFLRIMNSKGKRENDECTREPALKSQGPDSFMVVM